MKKVLVTGAAGYIGSVLTNQLLNMNCFVRGIDNLSFGGEPLLSIFNHPHFQFIKGDIRNIEDCKIALKNMDFVVHLAAIVGDPACAQQPNLAEEINWKASKMLFDLSRERKNIKRFIFASTCSNYGKMDSNSYVNEESILKPISLYAKLKVKFEKYLLESNIRSDFVLTVLRFSTVYGLSPRIRFDLTVNEFVRELAFERELVIYGEQFWRPYCHVRDLSRACILVLESKSQKVNYNVFGVGDTDENYNKKMLAEKLLRIYPQGKIKYILKDEDPRDYRVDFSKIKNELGFTITRTIPDGMKEIANILKIGILPDPFDKKYQNI